MDAGDVAPRTRDTWTAHGAAHKRPHALTMELDAGLQHRSPGEHVSYRQHQRSRVGERWPSVDLPRRCERMKERIAFGRITSAPMRR